MSSPLILKVFVFFGLVSLAAGIGLVDVNTGYTVNVVAFYSIPIIAGVWLLGNKGGYAVCVAAAIISYVARRFMKDAPPVHEGILAWNGFMRLITFSIYYTAASAVRFRMEAMTQKVGMLSGLLPICNCCKRIRDEHGYWGELESYLQEHSEASVEHKLCPDCSKRLSADPAPRSSVVPLARRH